MSVTSTSNSLYKVIYTNGLAKSPDTQTIFEHLSEKDARQKAMELNLANESKEYFYAIVWEAA